VDVAYERGRLLIDADRWNDDPDEHGAIFLFESPSILSCGVVNGIFGDRFED